MKQENCQKPRCEDPSAPDSVYCIKHRDLKKAANQRAAARRNGTIKAVRGVVKKTDERRAARAEAPAGVDNGEVDETIQALDRAIKRLHERAQKLERAKALLLED